MKKFAFIQYFFYLGINWNWRIAFYIIIHEIKGERKYKIQTTGSDELKKTKAAGIDISHATVYMPASYVLLEAIFERLPNNQRNHFLDIGSGKGRVLCVAGHHGYNKVTGIEFSSKLCEIAAENLQQTKKTIPLLNYSLIKEDASDVEIPNDVDCIFFFNPFDQVVMRSVAKNIADSFKKKPRNIYIAYFNPVLKEELIKIGFKEIYYTCSLKYLEAVILKKSFQS